MTGSVGRTNTRVVPGHGGLMIRSEPSGFVSEVAKQHEVFARAFAFGESSCEH